jgi:prepilin-type N-terminal cleavage/methylation domain-containing protein
MGDRRRAGFNLIEIAVVLAVVGAMVALAIPSMNQWQANHRLSESARSVNAALSFARSEAIRSGNLHIVFFDEDAAGNDLQDAGGNDVDILVLDEGRPGSINQDCNIDAGERALAFDLENDVTFGTSLASSAAPNDSGGGTFSSGSSFTDPSSNAASWVLFRPEGIPLAFNSGCTVGGIGSGDGGIYLTNGNRDSAVVLTPLGATYVHSWGEHIGAWRN